MVFTSDHPNKQKTYYGLKFRFVFMSLLVFEKNWFRAYLKV